jgi:dCMP deaminase
LNTNLIAYIPVLNKRHLDWLNKYPDADLYLISQELAEELVPRLSRNIGALPSRIMFSIIRGLHKGFVGLFLGSHFSMDSGDKYILPDEDVSHQFAEKYIKSGNYKFEEIWARYDMTSVKKQSPVIGNVEITTAGKHQIRMDAAKMAAKNSPDWFRQIGAVIVARNTLVSSAFNDHFPTEHSLDIMSDPRINIDAGERGNYTSFHAEKAAIIQCAARGISTKDARLYTTVFPCEDCARAIIIAGIKEVYFEEGYSTLDALEVLEAAKVKIFQVKD